MCKIQAFLLFLLIVTANVAGGKSNTTKSYKANHKKHNSLKEKFENERIKRSLVNDNEIPFWSNRGKKQIDDDPNYNIKYKNAMDYSQKVAKSYDSRDKNEPFWGNRGRRDSSMESSYEYEYPEYFLSHCEHCLELPFKSKMMKNTKDRREDYLSPFWGSRGRRNALEVDDISDPFWSSRGRRQEKEPFWGNRGRRTENDPFWGNRGRREDEPFWGNRGRREDMEPFWGNRGRRQNSEPFWGNRGRRQDNEPFWGNRGRREDEPFWGNRGRRKESERNWVRNGKEDFKNYIFNAIDDVENDIGNLSWQKKSGTPKSFWANRGRDNTLAHMFNAPSRTRTLLQKPVRYIHEQTSEPGIILDNKMYVDEPNYILIERSSRASGEEDPYYISRGKKYYFNYSLEQAARDRRSAIEEIVKSVRNDPYYIARGKKDADKRDGNSTTIEEYSKAKDLICAAIDLILTKKDGIKVKRDINDSERDRRTTLKKLAAQLQIDPYFVSRGKKLDPTNDYLKEFITNVADKCI